MRLLWGLIQDYYERTKLGDRMNHLDLKDFVSPNSPHKEYPVLSCGNMSKVRRLIGFGVELATMFNERTRRDRHRLRAMKDLSRIYTIVYEGDDFLSPELVSELQSTIDSFLAHQNWLYADAEAREVKMYNVTIKSHYLWHIGQDAVYYNPRLGWTYSDEDFVGKVASLARATTVATTDITRPSIILRKYLAALMQRWMADLS